MKLHEVLVFGSVSFLLTTSEACAQSAAVPQAADSQSSRYWTKITTWGSEVCDMTGRTLNAHFRLDGVEVTPKQNEYKARCAAPDGEVIIKPFSITAGPEIVSSGICQRDGGAYRIISIRRDADKIEIACQRDAPENAPPVIYETFHIDPTAK